MIILKQNPKWMTCVIIDIDYIFLYAQELYMYQKHLMNYHGCQFSLQTSIPKNCDSCEKYDNEVV